MIFDERICAAVDNAFESEHIPWLQKIVDQPSHTGARDDVEAAAALIDALCASIGLRRSLCPDSTSTFADHRIYSTPGTTDEERAVALVGHCDTVFPRSLGFLEFDRDPASASSGGDVIRGPGVLDMKSGLSVILFALQALSRAAPERFAQLRARFVCNTDEEVGSPTSRTLFQALAPRISMAMVFEGGRDEDRIITRRKGTGTFTLSAFGQEAHAGIDHASGANAIHALALMIPAVEALTDYARGTTVNTGLIQGGTAKNTVPGTAVCTIDARVTTMAEADKVTQALQDLAENPFQGLQDVPERLEGVRAELDGGFLRPPMEATPESRKLQELYEEVAGPQGLGTGEAPLQGGGSDANLLAAEGIPTIDGLGPYGKFFHSPKEWSSLASLHKRTRALACFLARISEQGAGAGYPAPAPSRPLGCGGLRH